MLELAGPLAVAALVLAAGGAFKLRDPESTRTMWRVFGVSRGSALVLAVGAGLVEVTLGLATFLVGGRVLAALTGAVFFTFAVMAEQLVRRPEATSCGCFGRHSGTTTRLHVVVDLVVGAVAAIAAVTDAPGFLDARSHLPGAGLVFVALAGLGAWFVIATMTVLPEALVAARRRPRTATVRTFEIRGSR
jgi:hypothetical protein